MLFSLFNFCWVFEKSWFSRWRHSWYRYSKPRKCFSFWIYDPPYTISLAQLHHSSPHWLTSISRLAGCFLWVSHRYKTRILHGVNCLWYLHFSSSVIRVRQTDLCCVISSWFKSTRWITSKKFNRWFLEENPKFECDFRSCFKSCGGSC